MAFTFGFYNSLNGDRRYNAIQMSMLFDGIIRDGVYMHVGESFIVKTAEEANTVLVTPGRAWFNHTWNYNDADLPLTGEPPELIMDRIDALVIDIQASDSYRSNQIKWITGEPTASPARPTLVRDDENLHWQYPLAYVYRKAMATMINQEDITNMVGTNECPFVTGVLETMNIDNLVLQWQDQWNQFVINYEQTATDWTNEQKESFEIFYEEFRTQLEEFKIASEKDFNDWYASIKDMLSDDVALNIINRLNNLTEKEFLHYEGLISGVTVINHETGVITTTTTEGVNETVFSVQNGKDIITTTITPNEGAWKYIKHTTIDASLDADTITTNYEKIAKAL